jgi:hypothetical protein
MLLKDLVELHSLGMDKSSFGTDKLYPKSYIQNFYQKEFADLRLQPIKLLEIGVRGGASIKLWSEFFTHPNSKVIGADINDVNSINGPKDSYVLNKNSSFICGDAYTNSFSKQFNYLFDIIIDDGPHSLTSQIEFIKLYLEKLNTDGVAVIEDIQNSYKDVFFLTKTIPWKYGIEIYDFRKKSNSGDDFLLVIKNGRSKSNRFLIQCYIYFKFFLHAVKSLLKRAI